MKRSRSQSPGDDDQQDNHKNKKPKDEGADNDSDSDQDDMSLPPTPRRTPGRTQNSTVRSTRIRPPIRFSDPHPRVPANYVFPPGAQQLGRGVDSGRNWLVMRDGDNDPVLHTSLIIVRCKRDTSHGAAQYPDATAIIPAGTTLRQVCELYPRHVWGEMLRIFLAESWDARSMWEAIPHGARNNSTRGRAWNYFQAAMGRELDIMHLEETGTRRLVLPTRVAQAPAPSTLSPAAAQPVQPDDLYPIVDKSIDIHSIDWDDAAEVNLRQLVALTSQQREHAIELSRAILLLRGYRANEREAIRYYRRQHDRELREVYRNYQELTGQEMGTREAIPMYRLLWIQRNPRVYGETMASYNARATWNAWRNYGGMVQNLTIVIGDYFEALWEDRKQALAAAEEAEAEEENGASEDEPEE